MTGTPFCGGALSFAMGLGIVLGVATAVVYVLVVLPGGVS